MPSEEPPRVRGQSIFFREPQRPFRLRHLQGAVLIGGYVGLCLLRDENNLWGQKHCKRLFAQLRFAWQLYNCHFRRAATQLGAFSQYISYALSNDLLGDAEVVQVLQDLNAIDLGECERHVATSYALALLARFRAAGWTPSDGLRTFALRHLAESDQLSADCPPRVYAAFAVLLRDGKRVGETLQLLSAWLQKPAVDLQQFNDRAFFLALFRVFRKSETRVLAARAYADLQRDPLFAMSLLDAGLLEFISSVGDAAEKAELTQLAQRLASSEGFALLHAESATFRERLAQLGTPQSSQMAGLLLK